MKINKIRDIVKTNTKQDILSVIFAIIIGFILGLGAKLADNIDINPIFDDLGGRLGIWIFTATLLAVFSNSPKLAAIRIFAFFTSMLFIYYIYTIFFLHFFPKRQIIFWSLWALFSPICGFIIWFSRGKGWISNILAALPITLLLLETTTLKNAYLPVHTHYYLIPWLQGIYFCFIILLLVLIPKNKRECFSILILSFVIFIIIIKLDVLTLLFGGWNSYFISKPLSENLGDIVNFFIIK